MSSRSHYACWTSSLVWESTSCTVNSTYSYHRKCKKAAKDIELQSAETKLHVSPFPTRPDWHFWHFSPKIAFYYYYYTSFSTAILDFLWFRKGKKGNFIFSQRRPTRQNVFRLIWRDTQSKRGGERKAIRTSHKPYLMSLSDSVEAGTWKGSKLRMSISEN